MSKKTNHIRISDKSACCGCTSCFASCPCNAILMKEDDEGFRYPSVDESKCIDCGLCLKRCPLVVGNQNKKTNYFFAVKHKQEDIRAVSSSGGVFSAMAQAVISEGGIVYGAAYDDGFEVHHIRSNDQSWTKLRTAKYVQSNMGDIFVHVKADLKQGKKVLFTGTPCQIDGLKLFLQGTDTEQLITCDLICHGVPSPGIWKDYLLYLIKKNNSRIGKVNFRNKEGCGWHNSTVKIESTDGKVILNEAQSQAFFSRLFFNHLIIRPCCYSCQYANLNRAGDITIGDYWGIENHHPELDDDRGTSLVMANTIKGKAFLEKISDQCQITSIAENECLQPNLKQPAQDYGGRDSFWKSYKKYGLEWAGKRMGHLDKNLIDEFVVLGMRVIDKIGVVVL